ncbi:hypothetical protein ACFL0I_03580 [Gemmatimonadota bacterium]
MKTWKRSPLPLLLALPVLQACGGGAGAWQGTVTDSAGITIVQNTSMPMWAPEAGWTVTEDLRIGTIAGEPEYQFGRLAFLDVSEDGVIYAMDMQAQEVKVYDAQGTFRNTIGGPGQGPGEIGQGAAFVLLDPDGGVVIPDLTNRRVSRYSSDGTPQGSFPIGIEAGLPAIWTLDDSGRLMAQIRGLNVRGIAALEEGDPIVVYDTTGTVVDTVAMLPKGQTLAGATEEQFSMVLFSPEPVWDLASDGSVYYAMSDQYRILVNAPDGTLTRIITRESTQKPVEESDQEAILRLMRQQYAEFGVPPAQIEQVIQGVGFAEYYPVFGGLFIGPEGTLWVQRVRSAQDMAEGAGEEFEFDPQDIASTEWEVFDDQGRYLGIVTLPEGFRPVTAKGDYLYGVWQDELDVQYVMRLTVNRTVQ